MRRCSRLLKGVGPNAEPLYHFFEATANRPEPVMLAKRVGPKSMRNLHQLYSDHSNRKLFNAIPRDLGEIPRNYVMKILYMNQPSTLTNLWELCKKRDDCPIDSATHLRYLMKIAAQEGYVHYEQNQSDNMYYLKVKNKKLTEVQQLIHQEQQDAKAQAKHEAAEADQAHERARAQQEVQADQKIAHLQRSLILGVQKLREVDPAAVKNLPFVLEDGSIDLTWWDNTGRKTLDAE